MSTGYESYSGSNQPNEQGNVDYQSGIYQPCLQTQPQPEPPIYQQAPGQVVYQQDPNQQQYMAPPQVVEPNPQEYGSPNQNKADYSEPVASEASIQHAIRRGFIIKTYGIVLSQLLITFSIAFLSFIPSVSNFFTRNNGTQTLFALLALILILIILIMLSCCQSLRRTVPINYILLLGLTLCFSYYLLFVCSYYTPLSVLNALGLTIAATVGLTVYAATTKTDYTFCGFFLFSFIFVLTISGIMCIFFSLYMSLILIEAAGVLLYSLYLIYDTQLVLGKFGVAYNVEDYISAALNIYLDNIYIFLKLLSLFGKSK